MDRYRIERSASGERQLAVKSRGFAVLRDPLLNKGTAFTPEERNELGIEGLLPHEQMSMEQQEARIFSAIDALPEPLQKYAELQQLHDRNEHLFYRVLSNHLEALMPIVYTPTVGEATKNFSHVFRRGRGVWLTPAHRGRMREILRGAADGREIRLMVVTDNEAILGIGDQGAGGMAISIGKLALYTAGAGIPPANTLPISLDVGTNNQTLLDDDMYLGWRQPRLSGKEYTDLVEEFVLAVHDVFPGALVQWEDFRKDNALNILDRFRGALPSFNDDIQGTGAVALAGVMSAMRISGVPAAEQRILIYGAGAAGLGIARQLRAGLASLGVTGAALEGAVGVMDSSGLLVSDRPIRDEYKRELAWPAKLAQEMGLNDPAGRTLEAVINAYKPTVLVGSSGQGGAFDEASIRAMAAHTERPVVMPFSNPTANAEAVPEDIVRWTDGRAVMATGSPFAPVTHGDREIHIGQGNNAFIFPGLGLGTLISGAREVTDGMIAAAANALANTVTEEELAKGFLFPPIPRLREVSMALTKAVIEKAVSEGTAALNDVSDIDGLIEAQSWSSDYARLRAE